MPGYVLNPYAYMARAQALALSSAWEGFANVLVEAMACGTPVVSTNCESGPAEILEAGRWGRLSPVGDPQALADSICKALDEPLPPDTLRQRASCFSIEAAAQRYCEALLPGWSERAR